MYCSRLRSLAISFVLLAALLPANAAFLNNDLGGTTTVVDFSQFTATLPLSTTPVQAYTDGNGFAINMSTPADITTAGSVLYGLDLPNFTDALVSDGSSVVGSQQQPVIEFALAGGAVSAIGLRISALQGYSLSPVTLEVFDSNGNSLGDYTFGGTNGVAVSTAAQSPLNANLPPGSEWMGGFYGFDLGSGNSQIVRFRITGGTILMDDLRFGGLAASGGGPDPDPDPDPEAVPEPGTFLLCALALGSLSIAGRKSWPRPVS